MGPQSCRVAGCVALASPGADACTVHLSVGQRIAERVGIKCYACGNPFRIGAKFLVRGEGAFHLRPACLNKPASEWVIPVRV